MGVRHIVLALIAAIISAALTLSLKGIIAIPNAVAWALVVIAIVSSIYVIVSFAKWIVKTNRASR